MLWIPCDVDIVKEQGADSLTSAVNRWDCTGFAVDEGDRHDVASDSSGRQAHIPGVQGSSNEEHSFQTARFRG